MSQSSTPHRRSQAHVHSFSGFYTLAEAWDSHISKNTIPAAMGPQNWMGCNAVLNLLDLIWPNIVCLVLFNINGWREMRGAVVLTWFSKWHQLAMSLNVHHFMGALTRKEKPLDAIQLGLVRHTVSTTRIHWREHLFASIYHTMQCKLLYPLILQFACLKSFLKSNVDVELRRSLF